MDDNPEVSQPPRHTIEPIGFIGEAYMNDDSSPGG